MMTVVADNIMVEDGGLTGFTINGKQCEVLFTAECEDTNKSYVAYTDYSTDEGNVRVYVSSYEEGDDGGLRLSEIETEEEFAMIQSIIDQMQEEMEEEE